VEGSSRLQEAFEKAVEGLNGSWW